MHPPVLNIKDIALFLDFDGTLVDFAHSPEAVIVSAELKGLLRRLNSGLDGALALVTGRSLESLDALIDSPTLCAAGCHGAEWRSHDSDETTSEQESDGLAEARLALQEFAEHHSLFLEHKPHSLALHFRQNPALEPQIDSWIAENLAEFSNIRVINGKLVREVQLAGIHKGVAVEQFMRYPPFAGRKPVYLGDDVTDEDAFDWVNRVGGISVKVGEGETVAYYRLPDFRAVHKWLEALPRIEQS